MKRVLGAVVVAILLAGTQLIFGQGQSQDHGQGLGQDHGQGNPFIDHSDNGETIHVLPPQAALHSPHDTDPSDAPPHAGYAVYGASYGSGNLINHGGPVMGSARFQAVYWNTSLANSIQNGIDSFVASFSDHIAYNKSDLSADFTIVQQYINAYELTANGSFVDTTHDKGKAPNTYPDSSVRSYLASLFSGGKLLADEGTVYGLYFPSGMKISTQGGMSCSSFCGYHGHFIYNGLDIKYAVFPYTDCRACSMPGKQVIDILTIVTSHEIREAVTDPDLNAWYDGAGYEADDKCAWHNLYRTTGAGAWVQPEYSNGTADGKYPGAGCVVPNQ